MILYTYTLYTDYHIKLVNVLITIQLPFVCLGISVFTYANTCFNMQWKYYPSKDWRKYSNSYLWPYAFPFCTASHLSTQTDLPNFCPESNPMSVPDPLHPHTFPNPLYLAHIPCPMTKPCLATLACMEANLQASSRMFNIYQPTHWLFFIQPFCSARYTTTLQAWTRRPILYISPVSNTWLYSTSYFQTLGSTHLLFYPNLLCWHQT